MKKPRLFFVVVHPNRIASLLENFCGLIYLFSFFYKYISKRNKK